MRMRQIFALVFLFMVQVFLSAQTKALPTTDFTRNFCDFPRAWQVSRGEGVKITVISNQDRSRIEEWIIRLRSLAPEADVSVMSEADFLNFSAGTEDNRVFLLATEPEKEKFSEYAKAAAELKQLGMPFVVPAYFGVMSRERDYTEWRRFIKSLHARGAIVSGAHGREFQLGCLDFWKSVPVDIFALQEDMGGRELEDPGALVKKNIESAAGLTAAAVALIKSVNPKTGIGDIKKRIADNSLQVCWMSIATSVNNKIRRRVFPRLGRAGRAKEMQEIAEFNQKSRSGSRKVEKEIFGHCLNAAWLTGERNRTSGSWSLDIMHTAGARTMASGKGVVVAILDHMFTSSDSRISSHFVRGGSIFPDIPLFDERGKPGHGMWMAAHLLSVAPDVSIMPVRITGHKERPAVRYIKGINYALKNGARIITLSHRPIDKEDSADFDRAVSRAQRKGVTIVFIHYFGSCSGVIKTAPIEFARFFEKDGPVEVFRGVKNLFVCGTGFVDEKSFPYTWGFSQTAPLVAGVAAMMLEVNPQLRPAQIRKIMDETAERAKNRYPLVNAFAAVRRSREQALARP